MTIITSGGNVTKTSRNPGNSNPLSVEQRLFDGADTGPLPEGRSKGGSGEGQKGYSQNKGSFKPFFDRRKIVRYRAQDRPDLLMILILTTFLLFGWSHLFAADMIIGGERSYVVQRGDTVELIGARHGVFWKNIIKENNIDPKLPLPEGTTLALNNRKILPRVVDNGIIVNIPDRTLYYFKNGSLTTAIPVGVGLSYEENNMKWQTNMGPFKIVRKRKNPTWYVPPSIQKEMELKGKPVEETVPPGPDNPLGRFVLETSIPGILIHETNRPRSVYRYLSHGCIRVLPEHMEVLYSIIDVGVRGEIIYEPVKLAVMPDGKVYLEVRTDMYKLARPKKERVRALIQERNVGDKVDWQKVDVVVKEESGLAEDVTLPPPARIQQAGGSKASVSRRVLNFFGFKNTN